MSGKCTYPEGDIYQGEFQDGKPHGHGLKIWVDGRKYVGEFFNGKPCGKGTKTDKDGT